MIFSEKWGKDVEEAVTLALKDLKLERDQVDVIVLEEPSKGFLGIGSKLAKVRVEPKKVEEVIEEVAEPVVEKVQETKQPPRSDDRPKAKGPREPREPRESREPRENQPAKPRKSELARPEDLEPLTDHLALDFLKETTEKMNLSLSFTASANKDNIYIEIEGSDAGTIIGKRGQTLDAIQYLTSLVVNKGKEGYVRVVIDAENYRSKREKTLEQLAERLAAKVVKTRRSVRLEPMNPYERMVIHASLQDNDRVKTRSEGEEPYRRVIIELK